MVVYNHCVIHLFGSLSAYYLVPLTGELMAFSSRYGQFHLNSSNFVTCCYIRGVLRVHGSQRYDKRTSDCTIKFLVVYPGGVFCTCAEIYCVQVCTLLVS